MDDPQNTTSEIALEPVHLIEESNAIMRLGSLMLAAGTSCFRIKEAMNRAATAFGMQEVELHVTATEIVATFIRGGIFRSRVSRHVEVGVNADRIDQLERLSHRIDEHTTAQQLKAALNRIAERQPNYHFMVTVLAAIMACTGFAFLNNGGWQECLGVAIGVGCAQAIRMLMGKIRINQLAVAGICAIVSCVIYLGVTAGAGAITGQTSALHDAGFTSALLFLIPGFPLMTAALDLARLDLNAGMGRMTYAMLVIVSSSLGGWVVAEIAHLAPAAAASPSWPILVLFAARVVAGFCGVFGFAMMFNTPMRIALTTAVIGGLANALRLLAIDQHIVPQVSTFGAALIVGLFAFFVARHLHAPRITLTVPAILIMIPGSAAYRALVYLNAGQMVPAATNGIQALFVVIAIAVGLTIARMLTERQWSFEGFEH